MQDVKYKYEVQLVFVVELHLRKYGAQYASHFSPILAGFKH